MNHAPGTTGRIHPGRALSVNLDHIATVRKLRGTAYPEVLYAAGVCENAGADGITLHLRGDRRHIEEQDVIDVRSRCMLPLTLEMAAEKETVEFALDVKPACVTLVPERPSELTTEGGLDAESLMDSLQPVVDTLKSSGIEVTLFLEPESSQINAASKLGCHAVEIHTGRYAILWDERQGDSLQVELDRIVKAVQLGVGLGLRMNAGHGIYYQNVKPLAAIPGLSEFSIGHGIISRSIFSGLEEAVREMNRLLH